MFRFSIREVLLVTLVIGLGIAWCRDRRDLADWKSRAKALEHVVREDGWQIEWQRGYVLHLKLTPHCLWGWFFFNCWHGSGSGLHFRRCLRPCFTLLSFFLLN